MDKYDVKLYIYDISKGLARSLSAMFLGRQLEGIWHTGIVVYGQEFFFGGMGIESCQPGCTVLGQPNDIVSLGSTELPFELFMDHLQDLSRSSFRPTSYHIIDHNCNSFTDDIAQFLTGNKIPEHITNLPQEVLSTPFGAMIKPFIDSVSMNHEGGHTLFNETQAAQGASAQSTGAERAQELLNEIHPPLGDNATLMGPEGARAALFNETQRPRGRPQGDDSMMTDSEKSKPTKSTVTMARVLPPIATYSDKTELGFYNEHRDACVLHLPREDVEQLDEAYEYVSDTTCLNWSLGPPHIKLLCRLIADAHLSTDVRIALSKVLQMALLCDDVIAVCIHDPNKSLVVLAQTLLSSEEDLVSVAIAKCVCNFVSTKPGAEKFACEHHDSSTLVAHIGRHLLLHSDRSLRLIGAQIASNVLRHLETVSEDTAFDLGIALIESCQTADKDSAEYLWFDLCTCIPFKTELAELVAAMGLDIAKNEDKFPDIIKYTEMTKRKFFT